MKITTLEGPPQDIRQLDDLAARMTEQHLEDIVEIFQTPLTGAYNWDYTVADNRIKRLYELGKELNWNASTDLDWSQSFPKTQAPSIAAEKQFAGFAPYDTLSKEEKVSFAWELLSQSLSNFLHGEQGALLVASQLVSCAPTFNAKLYAASQTFDEARHVEVFNRYVQERIGFMHPITPSLKFLLDKILTDPRWDLKFIGMQIIIEGLALAAFNSAQKNAQDPTLRELLHYVIRDEARHVTFGVNYLEEFVQTLSPEELEDRALFAYEACVVMRDRLTAVSVFEKYGWDVDAARSWLYDHRSTDNFRALLFSRVMPNLKRIGLLTDSVRPKFEQLGILMFEDYEDDGTIDWAELTKPLKYEETA